AFDLSAGHSLLAGEVLGESHSTWARLDTELADSGALTVSCVALLRMDFAAAGTLLNWVSARDERGQRVQFVDAHRLIATFFNVIGIANHATVTVRKD
ncbi:MAG: STAS domain-containing protein, partial [Gammaproteobacteria bacterium]|nr:STAS domain-containing protein [Gammaproteobacteria bacterium]